ncbi:hypothetical protein B0J11DRAFT_542474 [Dendryphion nanum]|uniref:Uncharacterized protein n=1 Tax=Dendryphion nanum TaxID=256645 RepID=A0A9P9I900_9PLEO|nr:hypothetical protein B0J11DRAFT_542474 [Dendryphion nanum]
MQIPRLHPIALHRPAHLVCHLPEPLLLFGTITLFMAYSGLHNTISMGQLGVPFPSLSPSPSLPLSLPDSKPPPPLFSSPGPHTPSSPSNTPSTVQLSGHAVSAEPAAPSSRGRCPVQFAPWPVRAKLADRPTRHSILTLGGEWWSWWWRWCAPRAERGGWRVTTQ